MSASATTHAYVDPATIAGMLIGHVGLLDIADDRRLALAILDRLHGTGIPLGRVTTDYDSVRADLTALIQGHIADRFDPAHLAAVEEQSRRLRHRLGRRSS